ncbi:glycosyltransferase-like domain-containing protein 1 [Elysia marginata]|uniref:tRNA-queuosine alpha-mannosyltransferase n=1 Tax=Elysia marginata TaxID=1093978 RepID=A0AAV4H001_9GAST|nr:glycosyltransferase-like domain-containing protein 1 [Elysia marginata]
MKDILVIEPFCGGSHEQLIQLLSSDKEIGPRCEKVCLPAKKWQWRARTSALFLSQVVPCSDAFRVLFASSVLNLAELVALRQDLSSLKKILYFHENQLVYPVRKQKERDFQYGYNQILSSLVADVLVFNSIFNMESFLSSISSFLKLIPDHRPTNLVSQMRPKCQVLYFPIDLKSYPKLNYSEKHLCNLGTSECYGTKEQANTEVNLAGDTSKDNHMSFMKDHYSITESNSSSERNCSISENSEGLKDKLKDKNQEQYTGEHLYSEMLSQQSPVAAESSSPSDDMFLKWDPSTLRDDSLHIVWPHRWEHDKDPTSFFHALFELQQQNLSFNVSVIGETFTTVPEIFSTARLKLGNRVRAWGYQSREDFLAILDSAHVVVSTALHEFFGVSMLEAVSRNCYPLCPNRLVYPEIYPKECLYSTPAQLVKKLKRFSQRPQSVNTSLCNDLVDKFSWEKLQGQYRILIIPKT